MNIGLRIDVDTLRGTREGVPRLCRALARRSIRASFFFSVGPDNMGRHLWRLIRPAFLAKMLRSNAPGLYGWDILLRGVFWPGPEIGARCATQISAAAAAGHEVGFHAWDHHAWQRGVERWDETRIQGYINVGMATLARIVGRPIRCSAAPGWRCTNSALRAKQQFQLDYNSDCRGVSVFMPADPGLDRAQPQVPTTLPTYDELIGRGGVTDSNYNEHLLGMVRPDGLNVLTIHAEVEGRSRAELFDEFLDMALARGFVFRPLGELVPKPASIPMAAIRSGSVPGREGWVAVQCAP